MNPKDLNINVIDPLTPAFERVKDVLFRPFNLGKWFVIGFCVWLAQLGQGGGGGGGGNFSNFNRQSQPEVEEVFSEVWAFIVANLYWIVPTVIAVTILGIAIGLVITWLNSRGRFMFLHCVALNVAEVTVPWNKYRPQANSLFWFRVVLGLISLVVTLLIAGLVTVGALAAHASGAFPVMVIVIILGVVLLLIPTCIIFALIDKFTMDFVVPIMYVQNLKCMEAWRQFKPLLYGRKGTFCLYVLFQIVIGMCIFFGIVAVFCATCCIACCISRIPYIGTVLLLPVFVFDRSYSLYFLQQFGPEFDVFPKPEEPTMPGEPMPQTDPIVASDPSSPIPPM